MQGWSMAEPFRIALMDVDEAALTDFARSLAAAVAEGGTIYLAGELGAGKTTFARALLGALGVGARVKSPTYSLIESYAADGLAIHHLDLYRIAAADEVEWLGLRDLAVGRHLWLIEWPERAAAALPAPDIRIEAVSTRASRWLDSLA
jgi:tRNA threonylcarbamoyladenosine biosynthesis protein TsaE